MMHALRSRCAAAALAMPLAGGFVPALAEDPPAPTVVQAQDSQSTDETTRRRPGGPPEPEQAAPVTDPNAVAPPQAVAPREFIPLPDRWRITDTLGLTHADHVWDPYNPNILKGDRPIFGDHWFLN